MNETTKPGTVYLVGVGPGDPGLLTVTAWGLLLGARVVLHDALIDQRILALVNPRAEMVFVGKRAGSAHLSQEEINRLLIERARSGQDVVRLKGGDPFVFGRGGEEALALARAGIPFEVVPGVTAAIAAGAYAGIPLTHRGLASACVLVTGHEDPAKPESGLDWSALAHVPGTLAVYMGTKKLAELAQILIRSGKPADTPTAVIASGTLPEQRTVSARLDRIAQAAVEAGIEPPAMVLVGEVVDLRSELGWFERRPLLGKRVLVTRPVEESSELVERLRRLGARAVVLPTIVVEPVADTREIDRAIARLDTFHWTVFSSANAVSVFFDRLAALGLDARAFGKCRVAAMGVSTAGRLVTGGVSADLVPAEYGAESLLQSMRAGEDLRGKEALLPRSDIGRETLSAGLRESGAEVTEVTLYRTVCPEVGEDEVQRMLAGGLDVLTFTSSSTVTNFVSIVGKDRAIRMTQGAIVAAIGPTTAGTLREMGLRVDVEARRHTVAGLVRALLQAVKETDRS